MITLLFCNLQKEDNIPCSVFWRTSKQVFDNGILNMAWNMN